MNDEACCTCATLLSAKSLLNDNQSEKKLLIQHRRLNCCSRIICENCITENSRFASYCPFCQVSSSTLHSVRDPPVYSPLPVPENNLGSPQYDEPPAYSSLDLSTTTIEKCVTLDQPVDDVLHFLDSSHDTILSLSLRYGVPQDALRRANGLFADHLLAARRAIVIPGEFYKGGISLSPQPPEGEEEESRKAKIRRWMVACKVAEYDLALIYLEQAKYNLDLAVEAYLADETWEKRNPIDRLSEEKSKQRLKRQRRLTRGH